MDSNFYKDLKVKNNANVVILSEFYEKPLLYRIPSVLPWTLITFEIITKTLVAWTYIISLSKIMSYIFIMLITKGKTYNSSVKQVLISNFIG